MDRSEQLRRPLLSVRLRLPACALAVALATGFVETARSPGTLGTAAEPTAPERALSLSGCVGLSAAPVGEPSALRVSLGASLEGLGAAAVGKSDRAAALLEALGLSAVNVAAPDLSLGADALRKLAAASKVPLLSANVRAAGSPDRLLKPFAVARVGTRAVGIVGLTEAPTRPVPGLEVGDPASSLSEILPTVRKECELVLVLGWLDASAAAEALRRAPGPAIAIVASAGVAVADPVEVGASRLVIAPRNPSLLSRMELTPGAAGRAAVSSLRLEEAPRSPPAPVRALLRECGVPLDSALERAIAARGSPEAQAPPASGEGRSLLPARTGNRGVDVIVHGASLRETYAGLEHAPGGAFLVVDTEWTNGIPLTLIYERQVPTEYRIPELGDHLYAVVDGRTLLRVVSGEADLPGHLPRKDFRLERIGSRIRGNAVFDLPSRDFREIRLCFYDFAHGHFSAEILRTGDSAPLATPAPIAPPSRNEVVELGVYGARKAEALGDRTAPEGMTFLTVDLRARSLYTFDADASAFDPKARAGAKMKVGTVADWKESRTYLQLIADGEQAYFPLEASTLGEEPRFLPDLPTGGDAIFLVPEKTSSLELLCGFPNARTPAGAVIRPKAIRVPIEGQRPAPPARSAIASIDDEVFKVEVTSQRVAPPVGSGEDAILTLEVSVANVSKGGEIFQTREQLRHVAEDGTEAGPAEASFEGLRPAAPLLWIPAGERRVFEVRFSVPAEERRPRLAYSGVSLAKVVDLRPVEVAAAPPAEAPKPRDEPAEATAAPAEPEEPTEPAETPEEEPAMVGAPEEGATEEAPPEEPGEVPAKVEATVPVGGPRQARGLAGVGLTPEEVNRAIDRGSAFLWNFIRTKDLGKTKRPFGYEDEHYIAALALVHSDAHRKFPDFATELEAFVRRYDPYGEQMYHAGLVGMTVEAYGDPGLYPKLEETVRCILEAQGPDGSWSYTGNLRKAPDETTGDEVLEVYGSVPPEGQGPASGWARMTAWDKGRDGDNSVSQFALLGLHAASRCGIRIADDVWARTLAECAKRQSDDGGWGYTTGGSYGSMTAAGVCALAVTRHQLAKEDPRARDSLRGQEWLAKHFTVAENPEHGDYHYYYLYSVERAGRLMDTEFIGNHEWYPQGARWLVDHQGSDGGWVGENSETDPRLSTSLALLFLTRATPTLSVQATGPGELRTGVDLGPATRYYFILDASGSMLATMDGRPKFDIARDAVSAIVRQLPSSAHVGLRVYGHRKRALEEGANEDTALEVPLGALDPAKFLAKLGALRARGKTPLAKTLLDCRGDLSRASEADPIRVILLTDGGEDTQPRGDPIAAAAELKKLKGIRLEVVGFDIGRPEWTAQLLGIARTAGGRYWAAMSSRELERELRAAVLGMPDAFVVLDAQGGEVGRGSFGDTVKLPQGKYRLVAEHAAGRFDRELWIRAGVATSVVFHAARVRGSESTPGAEAAKVPGGAAPPAAEAKSPPQPQPKPERRFCTSCGKPVDPAQRFCSSCGAKLGG